MQGRRTGHGHSVLSSELREATFLLRTQKSEGRHFW